MSPSTGLFIQSVEKALSVLEAFRTMPTMNLQEMSQACDISTSSAQRIAHTLASLGYLRKHPQSRRYSTGPAALKLGLPYLANEPLLHQAHSVLHRLHQECGETVNFSIPDGDDMVFVMRLHSHKHIPVYMPIGMRIPALSSSSGRAWLAGLPPAQAERRIDAMQVAQHTPNTTRDKKVLGALVEEARRDGYAYADEEFFKTDLNVAAAVFDQTGEPVAAVNISVPSPRWTLADARRELAPLAIRAARAISRAAPLP
ncbi:IclR family transcriptional regulator [Verticiella sediminum]|uniref:IclR family transcriptional regulator n=1 Tax=Verticiella sediminum TaxID=1247510 RepID=A0A556A6K4_9BURK|nr:IclR family transcriptional regulator [Verticiella sediminum]TSH88508.1 IclR family transcriptional regulator [Verticiella sediminum]